MKRQETLSLGVVMEHRRIDHPWKDHRWSVVSVFPGAEPCDPTGPWPRLRTDGTAVTYHAGTLPLGLHATESADYKLNLAQKPPKIWVVLRPFDDPGGNRELVPFHVSACPTEAQEYLDGDEQVDVVAMPEPVVDFIRSFVDEHHVDRVFVKRKRKRYLPPEETGGPPRAGGSGS